MVPFVSYYGIKYILLAFDYVSKWVEVVALPNNEGYYVTAFFNRNIVSQCGIPYAIISNDGSHFCNLLFKVLHEKYGVKYKVDIPYPPQISGQAEVSNCKINFILANIVNANRTD